MLKVNNQKGSVLILALLLLVMVEVVLVSLLSYHHFGILYTKDLKQHNQALELMLGGEKWAMGLLKQVKQNNIQQARYTLSPTQTPYGVIQGEVWDAQALVNINNFKSKPTEDLNHYLSIVLKDYPEDSRALQSFLKTTIEPQANDSDQEQDLQPPIIDQSQLLYSITELLSNTDIKPPAFAELLTHSVVLPEYTGLNVNTATQTSLLSLSPNITEAQVQAIMALREQKVMTNLDELNEDESIRALNINQNDVVFKSQYYLAEISVIQENEPMKLYTLMKTNEEDRFIDIEVLWRSLGTR